MHLLTMEDIMKDGALNDTGSILFRNITSIITAAQLPSSAVFSGHLQLAKICTLSAKFSQFCSLWLFYLICDLWEFKYRKVVTNKSIWRMSWCLNLDDDPFSPGERTRIFQPKFWKKKLIIVAPCWNFFMMHFLLKASEKPHLSVLSLHVT